MSQFDFKDAITKAAQVVKQSSRCTDHGKSPDFTIIKTSKGANVKWNFCCDKLSAIVQQKFKAESGKHVAKASEDYLKDSLSKMFRK